MGKGIYSLYTEFGAKEFYKSYKDHMKSKGIKPISTSEYAEYFRDLTNLIRERLLDAETVVLLHRLGKLQISKFERTFKKPVSVDWKKTKELGFKIYHEDPYSYKLTWNKDNCIVKNKFFYTFKPCRTLERLSASKIKQENKDYYIIK